MCFILLECLQFAHLLLSIFGPSLRAKSAATEENKFNVNQYLLHSVLLELQSVVDHWARLEGIVLPLSSSLLAGAPFQTGSIATFEMQSPFQTIKPFVFSPLALITFQQSSCGSVGEIVGLLPSSFLSRSWRKETALRQASRLENCSKTKKISRSKRQTSMQVSNSNFARPWKWNKVFCQRLVSFSESQCTRVLC